MAKQFSLEIEKFGTKDNLIFISNIINNKISLKKELNSYSMWNSEISINLYIEDEYQYGTDDFLENDEKFSLVIVFILSKKSTYKAILMREIIIDEVEKKITNSFLIEGDDEDRYFEKVEGYNSYKVFINGNKYIYFDKSEIALFFYWAFQKKMLHPNVEKVISLNEKEIIQFDNVSVLKLMNQTIGSDLIYDYIKEEYIDFVVFYTAKINYNSPKNVNLYTDIGDVYPELTDFKNILIIDEKYNNLYNMFEEAYKNFLSI